MRFPASLAVVALAGLVALADGKKKEPELAVRAYIDGQFKAMLGDKSRPDTRQIKTDAGVLDVNTVATKVSGDLTLSVTWTDYPESFKAVPAEKLVAAARDGLKAKDAKLVSEKDVAA